MSLLFGPSESRAAPDPTLGLPGGFDVGSLSSTSMKRSLRTVAVFSAVSLIAEALATTPAGVYKRNPDGTRTSVGPSILADNPNPNPSGTRVEWIHQYVASMKLRGNAYGVIVAVDRLGVPSKIKWLNPESIRVDESGPLPVYLHNREKLDPATVVHVADFVLPGSVVGLGPVELFRKNFEMAEEAQAFGAAAYKQSGIPSGHLRYLERALDALQSSVAKQRFKAAVANNDVFVSGKDWEYKEIGLKPSDSLFLDSIKASANQIAAIFKVPPEEIGGEAANGSLTYSTLELNQIKFNMRSVQPTAIRLEHHLTRLLPESQYFKFNLNATVRSDLKSRLDAYAVGLKNGIYTLAQVRQFEDSAMLTDTEIEQWQKWYSGALSAPENNQQGGAPGARS
ncbi:phage portal protein [Arthrobacter sp. B1805]|uniref:phage portal protein n=1 Tax=Arthrobacter sp. B1805 TaxID=2058892 RepID=UPI0011B00F82|nr:phage portal protein [Arthrobacter sp. B1805]